MKAARPLVVLGALSLTSAQVTVYDNGTITCPIANATYCLGQGSNIIVRCINGLGHAGNCNDNVSGEPPLGVSYAPCFQCSPSSGRAACSKNGTVYPNSGSGLGFAPFPVSDGGDFCSPPGTSLTTNSAGSTVATSVPGSTGPFIPSVVESTSITYISSSSYYVVYPGTSSYTYVPPKSSSGGPIATSVPFSGPFIPIPIFSTSITSISGSSYYVVYPESSSYTYFPATSSSGAPVATSSPYSGVFSPSAVFQTTITNVSGTYVVQPTTNPGGPIVGTSSPYTGPFNPSASMATTLTVSNTAACASASACSLSASGYPVPSINVTTSITPGMVSATATPSGGESTAEAPSSSTTGVAAATTNAAADLHVKAAGSAMGLGALFLALGLL